MTAMKTSISEVLETMFFLPLDFPEKSVEAGAFLNAGKNEMLAIKLNYKGPFAGCFVLFIPGGLARSFAVDFLGTDDESISMDQVGDVAKEITNMIAGGTFGHYDDSSVFHLDIPEPVSFKKVVKNDSRAQKEIFVGVETLEDRMGLKIVVGNST
jgi:CheY-specific phosphatase CheX